MSDLRNVQALLVARQRLLQSRLTGIESALDAPHAQDWGDDATEREGDEVLETLGLSGLSELRKITAALGRIEDGSYGACARCGVDIDADRLKALPEAALCRACAQAPSRS